MQKLCSMFYLGGFVFGCFFAITLIPWAISKIHSASLYRPAQRQPVEKPLIKSRTVISFSIILPFVALSFLTLTYAALRLAESLGQQGHLLFVFSSLLVPAVCFLSGFTYFKKSLEN